MAKKSIVVSYKLPKAVEQRLKDSYDAVLNPSVQTFNNEKLLELSKNADGLVVSIGNKLDAGFISRLSDSVKIIASFSVGFEHIDIEAASKRNIAVTNTPGVLTDATADIAMLLMLGAARRAVEGEHMVRSGQWIGWNPVQLLGTQVTGKKLGILGMGRIGQAVAKRAKGFDMEIHYHNRKKLSPETEAGAKYHDTVEGLLAESEFLSLHCPATPNTIGFLNSENIAKLPDGAVVINTSRGSVVNDNDFIAALKSGKIAAAGLDVFDNEPNITEEYKSLPNCFMLPHLGSASVETRNAMGFMVADNLDAFFAGKQPPNAVSF